MSTPRLPGHDPVRSWAWSDDPDNPCTLCVHWRSDDPDDDGAVTPVLPSGPVPRVYRGIHDECDEAVSRYLVDVDDRPEP